MNSISGVSSVPPMSNWQANEKEENNAILSKVKEAIEGNLKDEDQSVQNAGAADPDTDDVTYSNANQN